MRADSFYQHIDVGVILLSLLSNACQPEAQNAKGGKKRHALQMEKSYLKRSDGRSRQPKTDSEFLYTYA